jgi:hypothetical protein
MSDPIPSNQPGPRELMRLGRATRFAIVCVVVGLSYLAIRSCLGIPKFVRIFSDMLGEAERLPAITALVIRGQSVLLALSYCIPAAAVGLLFMRDVARSLYCLGILILISIVTSAVVIFAMYLPMMTIIEKIQGPGP